MNKAVKEPIYPLRQSILNALTDFLCDDSTTGKIGRGSILLSALQGIANAGPLPLQANGKDEDADAQAAALAVAAETKGATE